MVSASDPVAVEREWMAGDGVPIFLRDYAAGEGPPRLPVVCLHGLTRNSKDFVALAPVLVAMGRRVLLIDMRGRGRSGRSPDPRDYAAGVYANDVTGLLDALGIAGANFLGTSMGGLIAMVAATKRPALVRSLILNDIGPEIDQAGLDRIKGYAGKATDFHSWDEAGGYMAEIGKAAFPDYDHEDWIAFAKLNHSERNTRIVVDCDPAIAENLTRRQPPKWLMWYYFRKVAKRRPTLLIRGLESDLISHRIAARMMGAVPSMELAEVPRVGHAPMLDEPVARAALKGFLSRVP